MNTRSLFVKLFIIIFLLVASIGLPAQDPPPPPGGGHGMSGNQSPPGGGAPLGSGLYLLCALSGAYGAVMAIKRNKKNEL